MLGNTLGNKRLENMKICFLTDDPSSIGGGLEHLRQVDRYLRKSGFSVETVSPLSMDTNFDFFNFFQRIKYVFWVLRFLLVSDYDIYHSHTFSTSAFLPMAKLRGKKTGITVHGLGVNLVGAGFLNKTPLPKILAWLILSVWPFDFRFSASHLDGYDFVGNGVDINEFKKIKRIPHKGFNILCVSRRDPAKGVKILESAVKKIPGIKLNLVSGRPRMLTDFANADLYVLPSLSEGLPIVLLEAMAAKLPVVVTDVGECRKIVEKARCGLVVPPGKPEELIKAIEVMVKNKKRAKLGERGFTYVAKNFSWDKVAAVYHFAYSGRHTKLEH